MVTCRYDAMAHETLVKAETIPKADASHLQKALLALHAVGGLLR